MKEMEIGGVKKEMKKKIFEDCDGRRERENKNMEIEKIEVKRVGLWIDRM